MAVHVLTCICIPYTCILNLFQLHCGCSQINSMLLGLHETRIYHLHEMSFLYMLTTFTVPETALSFKTLCHSAVTVTGYQDAHPPSIGQIKLQMHLNCRTDTPLPFHYSGHIKHRIYCIILWFSLLATGVGWLFFLERGRNSTGLDLLHEVAPDILSYKRSA